MKRRKTLTAVFVLAFVSVCVLGIAGVYSGTENNTDALIEEVSIYPNKMIADSSRSEFDLKSILNGTPVGNDEVNFDICVFEGTITDLHEYKVSWVGEGDETYGPYSRSIIDVEVDKCFKGGYAPGDKVKVLYASSLSATESNSVRILKGQKYVFINCWLLNDNYFDYTKSNNPDEYDHDKTLKMADVIMGGAWNSLMPIDGEYAFAYHEYFDAVSGIEECLVESDDLKTESLTSERALSSGDYLAVNAEDIDSVLESLLSLS